MLSVGTSDVRFTSFLDSGDEGATGSDGPLLLGAVDKPGDLRAYSSIDGLLPLPAADAMNDDLPGRKRRWKTCRGKGLGAEIPVMNEFRCFPDAGGSEDLSVLLVRDVGPADADRGVRWRPAGKALQSTLSEIVLAEALSILFIAVCTNASGGWKKIVVT